MKNRLLKYFDPEDPIAESAGRVYVPTHIADDCYVDRTQTVDKICIKDNIPDSLSNRVECKCPECSI